MTVEKVEQIRAFEGCVVPAVVYRADDTPCSRHAGVGKGVEGVGPGRPKRRSRHYPPHVGSWVEKHWAQKTGRLGGPDINVDKRIPGRPKRRSRHYPPHVGAMSNGE